MGATGYVGGGSGGGAEPGSSVTPETAYAQAAAVGTSEDFAPADHTHGTPALPSAAQVGADPTGAAAAAQAAAIAAIPAFGAVTAQTTTGATSASGAAGTVSRSDHTHGTPALSSNTPQPVTPGDVGAAGNSAGGARANHVHAVPAYGTASGTLAQGNDVRFLRQRHVSTGLITGGSITVSGAAFTQIGTDLAIAAATGDVLELGIEALVDTAGPDLVFDAATRVSAADTRWFSSGGVASNYPGSAPTWFCPLGGYRSPGRRRYVVAGGDVSGGTVTVRTYARADGSTRTVLASAAWPLQVHLTNLGPVGS